MASHRKAGPLTGRQGLSQGGRASHGEARSLTGRPGLSQGDRAYHREAWPLGGRLGLLQGGLPLTGKTFRLLNFYYLNSY